MCFVLCVPYVYVNNSLKFYVKFTSPQNQVLQHVSKMTGSVDFILKKSWKLSEMVRSVRMLSDLGSIFSSICARNLFFLDVEVKLISFVLLSGSYFLGSGILILLCFWIELNLFVYFYSMLSSFSFPLSFSIPDLKFNYFLIYFFLLQKKINQLLLFFTYFCYYHG